MAEPGDLDKIARRMLQGLGIGLHHGEEFPKFRLGGNRCGLVDTHRVKALYA